MAAFAKSTSDIPSVVRRSCDAAFLLRLDHRRDFDGRGFFSAGVSNITMSVVLKPISDELGWSRALTAAAVTMGALIGGALSPVFGPIADRFGPRVLLPAGGLIVGLLAIGVSLCTEPWQFYATFVPARALGALLAGMAFDFTGNYQTIFSIFFGNYPLSALLIFLARPPAENSVFVEDHAEKERENEFSL